MNCDDTYSNKSWAIVAQNMFPLKEINQMEREMLGYLEWNVDVGLEQMQELQYTLDTSFNAFRLPSRSSPSSAASAHHLAGSAPRSAATQLQSHQLPTPASSTTSSPMSVASSAPASAAHSPAFLQSAAAAAVVGDHSYPSPPYSPCASLDFGASAASTPASSNASPHECKTPPNGEAAAGHHHPHGPAAHHHPKTAVNVADHWAAADDVHVHVA